VTSAGAAARVDVHHHFNAPGGRGGQPGWSPARAVEEMDEAVIALAIGWPGPVAADSAGAARDRASSINEFGASLVSRHPGRFGLFASLPPLADVDGALREIEHGLDVLGADGVGIVTHYGTSWLGDEAFRPVFAELDRRAAVVFVHPQGHSGDCSCGMLNYQTPAMSAAWLEYPFNTARSILNLMATGTLRAFPRIRFIFCHGGGALTSLLGRLEGFAGWWEMGPEKLAEVFPEGVRAEFQRLHFECAQACSPEAMTLLRSQVPDSQILFGTDYDRFPLAHTVERFLALELPAPARAAIEHGNARRLLGR
jgi:predicted TIM-barrel fold metal-dependent hydrolase